jgi:hypothetical protein
MAARSDATRLNSFIVHRAADSDSRERKSCDKGTMSLYGSPASNKLTSAADRLAKEFGWNAHRSGKNTIEKNL